MSALDRRQFLGGTLATTATSSSAAVTGAAESSPSAKPVQDAGYQGCYSVEHHSSKNEYAEVAVQPARVRAVFDRWWATEQAG